MVIGQLGKFITVYFTNTKNNLTDGFHIFCTKYKNLLNLTNVNSIPKIVFTNN